MERCIKLGFFEVRDQKRGGPTNPHLSGEAKIGGKGAPHENRTCWPLDQGPRGDERLLRQALWGEGYYEAVIYDPEGNQLELTI